jgi:hypothetical protein
MANATGQDGKPQPILPRLFLVWSNAIERKNYGVIIDLFTMWFLGIGIVAIIAVGVAAFWSIPAAAPPEAAATLSIDHSVRHDASSTPVSGANSPSSASGGNGPALSPTTGARPSPAAGSGVTHKARPVGRKADKGASIEQRTTDTAWGFALRVFGFSLVLAGACTILGWLAGLLFGVPRAVAVATDANQAVIAKTAPVNGGRKTASRVNTNLEDISDWLTKTLVGVGLVELRQVPDFFAGAAQYANTYGFGWEAHGQLLALGLMLYFIPGGFWLGYIGTRTLLTGLFDMFGPGWDDHVARSSNVDNLEIDGLNEIRPASGTVVLADAAVLSKPISELTSTSEVLAWAAAQARLGNLETARVALENALGAEPDSALALRQLVKVYLASKCYDQARKLAKDLPDSPPKMLASLYDPPPGGYQAALDMAAKLKGDYSGSASFHVWLACAYGQQYSNLIDPKDQSPAKPLNDPDVLKLKADARTEISNAIALDHRTLDVLRDLWRPQTDAEVDDDLSAFSDDDLRDILGDPPVRKRAPLESARDAAAAADRAATSAADALKKATEAKTEADRAEADAKKAMDDAEAALAAVPPGDPRRQAAEDAAATAKKTYDNAAGATVTAASLAAAAQTAADGARAKADTADADLKEVQRLLGSS